MAYDPYEINRIIGQVGNQLLGAGQLGLSSKRLGLEKRRLAMEEEMQPDRMSLLKQQVVAAKQNSLQKIMTLMYQFKSRGIPKEQSWPIMQRMMPEDLGNVDVKDIDLLDNNAGMSWHDKASGTTVTWLENPETGGLEMVKTTDPMVDPTSILIAKKLQEAREAGDVEGVERYTNILDTSRSAQFRTDTASSEVKRISQSGKVTGTGIESKRTVPANQVDEIATIETVLDDVANIENLQAWKYAGRVKGKVGKAKEYTGIAVDENEQKSRTATATLKKNLFDIGGKVLTGNELKILEPFIPTIDDPESVYKVKLENFKREYNLILKNKREKLSSYGYRNEMGQGSPKSMQDGKPDPVANNGRIIKDSETGERFQSNGIEWIKIQ